jgi:hypothetical protein
MPGAMGGRMVRQAVLGAIVVLMGLLLGAERAHAVCCICQATNTMPGCELVGVGSCDDCRGICENTGTMLACCGTAESSCVFVADSCVPNEDLCVQPTSGRDGTCQGSCLGPTFTPTATPTVTETATVTATPTVTPTRTPIPNGGACTTGPPCASGFCVDLVCCDTACTGPLEQCNLPGERGTCSSTAASAPTLTPWGMLVGSLVLAGIAGMALRRRMRSR